MRQRDTDPLDDARAQIALDLLRRLRHDALEGRYLELVPIDAVHLPGALRGNGLARLHVRQDAHDRDPGIQAQLSLGAGLLRLRSLDFHLEDPIAIILVAVDDFGHKARDLLLCSVQPDIL